MNLKISLLIAASILMISYGFFYLGKSIGIKQTKSNTKAKEPEHSN